MVKSLKSIYFLVGLFSLFFSLIGYPELLDKWVKCLGIETDMKTVIDQNVIRWIAFAVGMILIGIWACAHKKERQKSRRPKRDLSTGSILIEDEEIINDTLSPLKIEVQEDGNAYFDFGDLLTGGRLGKGRKHILSIRIHNTGKKTIDDVEVCVNKVESLLKEELAHQQMKLPIYLHFTDTEPDVRSLTFSSDQTRSVDVLSYSTADYGWHVSIEQICKETNPKLFISELVSYKIEIKVTGRGIDSSRQDFNVSLINPSDGMYTDTKQLLFMERVSNEQQGIIDSQRKTIESPKEQQRPKLEVTFEKGKKPYLEHFRKMSPITKRDGQLYYYRIRIENTCSEIIKNVNVKLVEIKECPDDFSAEGCNLEFRHHPGVKAKDIQPYDDVFVDIIGHFEPFNKDIKKKEMYMFAVGGMLKLYIPAKRCDITIKINSNNGGKPITKNIRFYPKRTSPKDMLEMD